VDGITRWTVGIQIPSGFATSVCTELGRASFHYEGETSEIDH
jgi:hypothetical protein